MAGRAGDLIYSQRIIQQKIDRIERRINEQRERDGQRGESQPKPFRLIRFPPDVIAEMCERLNGAIDQSSVNDKGHFRWLRDLEPVELAFIENELTMCQLDFRYACENYFKIQLASQSDRPAGWDELEKDDVDEAKSGGRIGFFLLNGMQLKLLERLAKLEEACYEALARGAPVNGILLILHKARQLGACLAEGTLVLTDDLRWVPIESVRVGDRLVSIEENPMNGKGSARKMRVAVVEGTRSLIAKTFRIRFSDGREIVATGEHRFLSRLRGGVGGQWRTVDTMQVGDVIRNFARPWGEPSYEDGWFGGLLDGEGSLRAKHYGGIELTVSQVAGSVLDRAASYLRSADVPYRDEIDNRQAGTSSKLGNQPVHKFAINQIGNIFSTVGRTQPSRFVGRTDWWEGKELPNNKNDIGPWAAVVSIEPAGEQHVYDLQTSTRTFIANGVVSHNSIMWQALGFHRINFYSHINGLTASIDDTSTQALFRRFERMWDQLPIWMRSKIKRQERGTGWQFERDSVMELQSGKQDKDLGKGETYHFVHVTECAVFERPEDHFDEGLFPTIPYSLYTLYGMEGTSKGKRGWWYDFVMSVMKGTAEDDSGAGRFAHAFFPFYLIDISDESRGQRSKYRIEAPVDWSPSANTQLVARRVADSSGEVCGVPNVILHRDILYWYERTRAAYYKRGKLNIFLQNFPLDPNESFQHSSAGAFSSETIEKLDNHCALYRPWPYTICGADELPERKPLETDKVRVHRVGDYYLAPMHEWELDRDPRGIIWLYEQPHERYFYSLGSDPTGGIPGWMRAFRTHNDVNTDNGTIELFRKGKPSRTCDDCTGKGWLPTSSKGVLVECKSCDGRGRIGGQAAQVAEFAAPVDAEELARFIYVIGRVFRGNSEMPECLAVVESNNTGILTIRKLQSTYEYTNLYQHESIDNAQTPRYTGGIGFVSSASSVPILHAWSRSVVMRRDIDIRSPYLVREMSDAIVKITGTSGESPEELARAKTNAIVVRERFVVPAGGGRHDDRMTGAFLSWWGLFDKRETDGYDEGTDRPPSKQLPNLAARDATAEEQHDQWNDAVEQYLEGQDLSAFGSGRHYPDCDQSCNSPHEIDDEQLGEEYADYEPDEYDPAYN